MAKRWDYMGHDNFIPLTEDCPECIEPSKTFFQGSKTVDGTCITRYRCEHDHEWVTTESRKGDI